ncbi:hypothetical protein CTI10_006710 [Delftia acidovorans]|uniref:Uncharacterized protein n=1 Tax=Chryseobacterium sp. B5 TaxID=2050562 RepID=A0A2G7T9P7_9FLAO|nr:hypothetical protein CTI10_006710 [Delftia acidovorans]
MQVIQKILLCLSMALFAAGAGAQVQQARGKASVSYQDSKVSPQDKERALMAAQLKAVEFYYAEAGQSEAENFDAVRDKILANPDRYILEHTVLSEEDNADRKQYTVSVRVALNVANLRNAVKANSAVARGGPAGRSPLAFMFVSRQVATTKSFDDRVYKRLDETEDVKAQVSASEKGSEGESIRGGRVSTNASTATSGTASVKSSRTSETGGSTTRRSAESTWRVIPSANLSQVFSSNFAKAGFKVSEAAMVEPYTGGHFKVAAVENDYKSGMDLQPSTLAAMVAGMRTAQIPYIALGTLDVGMGEPDPQTGLMRVSVTVNAKILDIAQTIPDTIAAVGPVLYAGMGPSEDEARNNALKLAANNAARDLTSQVTNLGLR